MPITTQEKEKLGLQLRKEYDAGLKYRVDAEKRWKLAEDHYFNKVTKSLTNRYNVPIPVVPGFVETLLSKLDDPPTIRFKEVEEADYKAVQKSNSFYRVESRNEDLDWEQIDLDGKKQAALYGRAIAKYYAESDPQYKSNLELVDVYDFYCDPIGGGHLEKHRFMGQDNIFRTKEALKEGVASGIYDKTAVEKLINATSADKLVDNDNIYRSKQSRMMALGMDGITHNFAGQDLYKLVESGTMWNGERYYALWNYETGLVLRCAPLKEVFESNLWQWVSWATHRDTFNFWSKAPVDDIIPLAEMMRSLVNQELDNRQKRNWGMRAYDPEVFKNPADLVWRPDGLIRMAAGSARAVSKDGAIWTFETPELQGTINLVQWIDDLLGQKSGVTADTQGKSNESKVGIYYGNMQAVAERFGLYNKSYSKFWAAIGRRYLWGLFEHLRSPQAVEVIGEKGNEWDEIVRTEINPKWNVIVEGGNAQLAADEVKAAKRKDVLATLTPQELAVVNPKWLVEQKLKLAEFEDQDIKEAFDRQNDLDKELASEAAAAIQQIIQGKTPSLNRGATTRFVQKILDYATDNVPMDNPQLFRSLLAYAEAHKPIIAENMARKAMQEASMAGISPDMMATAQPVPTEPAPMKQMEQMQPNTPQGTQSRSEQMVPQLTP